MKAGNFKQPLNDLPRSTKQKNSPEEEFFRMIILSLREHQALFEKREKPSVS
jgi:hypothetical protein